MRRLPPPQPGQPARQAGSQPASLHALIHTTSRRRRPSQRLKASCFTRLPAPGAPGTLDFARDPKTSLLKPLCFTTIPGSRVANPSCFTRLSAARVANPLRIPHIFALGSPPGALPPTAWGRNERWKTHRAQRESPRQTSKKPPAEPAPRLVSPLLGDFLCFRARPTHFFHRLH